MSYLYGLDPRAQARLSDQLDHQQATPNQPGTFDNFWAAVGGNLAAGGLKVAQLGTYFKDPDQAAAEAMAHGIRGDNPADWERQDEQARVEARRMLAQKAKDVMPNPIKTGVASNIVGGLAQVLPTAVAGAAIGGPVGAMALVGGSQGVGDYQESLLDGVDPATAAKKAALTGVVSGVGVAIPMAKAGAGLATNLGIGVGVNVGLGMGQRAGTAAILNAGGYHDMAAQYKWLDGEAIAVDALLGAAFGGMGHFMHGAGETAARPTPEHVDAALALNDRLHVENEAQPGVHRTVESRDAGVQAMEKAVNDMVVNDRMPDVAEAAARMDVEPNPAARAFHEEVQQQLELELPKREEAVDTLTPAEHAAKGEELRQHVDEAGQPVRPKTAGTDTDGKPLTPHDNTPEGMAKAGDVQPAEHAMAQQLLAAHPDLEIPVGIDADGNPTMRKFSDVMAEMDRDIAQAEKDSVLHDVAVACFLRG
jgi:hypothetical protein